MSVFDREFRDMIPGHWSVGRVKHHFSIVLGKMRQRDRRQSDDELKPYLKAANVAWRGPRVGSTESMWFSAVDRRRLLLQAGDLLVSEGGDIGKSCIWHDELPECYIEKSLNRVRQRDSIPTKFLYYWLYLLKMIGLIDAVSNTSTLSHFTADKLANTPMVLPPPSEADAIVDFLDRETARIDQLIDMQERLIQLVLEKREAVISHATCEGIDGNTPRRKSSAQWLGEIPSHWKVIPSKALFSHRNERARSSDEQLTASQQYGLIPQAEFMALEGRRVVEVIKSPEILKHVEVGDFVISMRSFQGGLEWSRQCGSVSSAYVVLKPRQELVPDYFRWLFKSTRYVQALQSTSNLVRDGQALRYDNFAMIPLPLIPLSEQREIANHVEASLKRLEELRERAVALVGVLRERRSALISAAVTGQIDVREWEATGTAEEATA